MKATFIGHAGLTCKLPGWQFDRPSGRGLTTGEPDVIRARRISP